MKIGDKELHPDDLMRLGLAAIVGRAHLAAELERVGISSEDDSLEDAVKLRPKVMAEVERARGGAGGV